uniref:LPS-assembly lipoprotein LptE n=1 Tax=Candidatus Kentrum sp. SD TaxID=2126332 RepID=A0A450YFP2_9GAMM|nr:MAG: LPS-assembly lipoprotein [Candidatus Kentron sp. SD]VFK40372.1 MAG: LPS-assembly lipoprotein [Candidatus Kentron sp. SD]
MLGNRRIRRDPPPLSDLARSADDVPESTYKFFRGDGYIMTFSMRLIGIFIIVVSLLTGCDFRLRGSFSLPSAISSLYIQVPANFGSRLLADKLVTLLESNGVIVASNKKAANATLVLESESFDKRTLSVDSVSGKEREHELAYTVAYRVLATDGTELLPRQTVNLARDYLFDESAVLGTSQEESVLYREMRQDAALQIIQGLAAWSLQ